MPEQAISPRGRIRRAVLSVTGGPLVGAAGVAPAPVRDRLRARLGAERMVAVRESWGVFWRTRTLVAGIAVISAALAGSSGGGNRVNLDVPGLSHPFGGPLGALFSALARWDALWYLGIAHHGYTATAGGAARSTAFFPLYPLLIRLTAGGATSPALLLVASYVVSLGAFAGALYVLHRLVTLELGRSLAARTLLFLAVFPAAFYFSAPYSESIFLLLTVGAFYAARTGRFGWAGALAAAASATRSGGVVLLVPLSILYLYGPRADRPPDRPLPANPTLRERLRPRYRISRDLTFLAAAPVGLAAYALHLALSTGDGLAYMRYEEEWYRAFAGPLGGVWQGLVAAFDGVRQLLSGSRAHHYFAPAGGDPFVAAAHNITLFVFLIFAAVALVGIARRLPAAYAAYVGASLAVPLSYPVANQPLMSLPRFLAVLFPIFMWLALACREGRRRAYVLAFSGAALGVLTFDFATWHWVA